MNAIFRCSSRSLYLVVVSLSFENLFSPIDDVIDLFSLSLLKDTFFFELNFLDMSHLILKELSKTSLRFHSMNLVAIKLTI